MGTSLGPPASIFMSPRQLRHYLRWQHLCTTLEPAEQGYLPTATEYEDFQLWLKRQDSGYFSDIFDDLSEHIGSSKPGPSTFKADLPIATICHHFMHPATSGQLHIRCPVCTINVHLNYVKVLYEALTAAGGRAPSCTLTASEHQDSLYYAWSRAKICTLGELSKLENMADKEIEWVREHPETRLDEIQTASKALEVYWFEMNGLQDTKSLAKAQPAVVFSEDTRFEPGRPQAYYWKRSPRYTPGKYTAAKTQDDEQGTISEDSEDYEDYNQNNLVGPVLLESRSDKEPAQDMEHSLRSKVLTQDLENNDCDSEWEDIDSDEDDRDREGDYIQFSIEEETSFIVFATE